MYCAGEGVQCRGYQSFVAIIILYCHYIFSLFNSVHISNIQTHTCIAW